MPSQIERERELGVTSPDVDPGTPPLHPLQESVSPEMVDMMISERLQEFTIQTGGAIQGHANWPVLTLVANEPIIQPESVVEDISSGGFDHPWRIINASSGDTKQVKIHPASYVKWSNTYLRVTDYDIPLGINLNDKVFCRITAKPGDTLLETDITWEVDSDDPPGDMTHGNYKLDVTPEMVAMVIKIGEVVTKTSSDPKDFGFFIDDEVFVKQYVFRNIKLFGSCLLDGSTPQNPVSVWKEDA